MLGYKGSFLFVYFFFFLQDDSDDDDDDNSDEDMAPVDVESDDDSKEEEEDSEALETVKVFLTLLCIAQVHFNTKESRLSVFFHTFGYQASHFYFNSKWMMMVMIL